MKQAATFLKEDTESQLRVIDSVTDGVLEGNNEIAEGTPRYIRLLGKPATVLGPSELSADETHSFVDLIDADQEESFTLDSFVQLCHAARSKGVDFILARVTTVDPNDDTKLYHSYYAAHHINKVLFRTQPEEGLLHRMKARNPLNNMVIVGDVHYFSITPRLVSIAEQCHQVRYSRKKMSNDAQCNGNIEIQESRSVVDKTNYSEHNLTHARIRELNAPIYSRDTEEAIGPKERVRVQDRPTRHSWFIDGISGRQRRLSADDLFGIVQGNSRAGIPKKPASTYPHVTLVNDLNPTTLPQTRNPSHRRSCSDSSLIRLNCNVKGQQSPSPCDMKMEQFHLDGAAMGKERGVSWHPSTHGEPPSYLKGLGSEPGMLTGQRMDPEDVFETTYKRLSQMNPQGDDVTGIDFDSFPIKIRSDNPFESRKETSNVSDASMVCYDAHYYGTDDDFLMKSNVREYFRKNAIEPNDYVLFTLYRSVDQGNAELGIGNNHEDSDDSITDSNDDTDEETQADLRPRSWSNLFGLLSRRPLSRRAARRRSRRRRTLFRQIMKWLFLLYLILGFVLIRYVVPAQYAYLVGFLLVFFLAFMIIFFVECEV